MKKVKLSIITVLLFVPFFIHAQIDCSDFFKNRRANPPYKYNQMSKSAVCLTGQKYEFIVPLTQGNEYRISFYASSVFNNKIDFKIIDQNSGEIVMSLPGESMSQEKGTCVLKEYFDSKSNKLVHPYFDFIPNPSTSLKIIIDIKELPKDTPGNAGYNAPAPRERGCVTVLILDKPAEGIQW